MDGIWAAKSEGVRVIVCAVSKIANLCGPDPPSHQRYRRMDRQTTCNHNTVLCTEVYRAVKMLDILEKISGHDCVGGQPIYNGL